MKLPSLIYCKENYIDIIAALTIRSTAISMGNYLYNHPDYPGLLNIGDMPVGYEIKNTPI